MAKSRAVWGIDIGNCSLKALRLRAGSGPEEVLADAFDYIEYPKILTQPGAEPGELIQDALKQFLSRNSVRGDRVAISVSGQNGLARFVKLPPVEAKKIPDIVRFEARQQIPFDLNDVVWDYQRMGGGAEEEGFLLETEIGLFAMKRDQVLRALQPFNAAGIPVDFVQLTPLSLYNYVAFDFLTDLPAAEEYNPDDPPPSVVVLSLGTDATDLVVTNGFRVWQRSIPLGGNHFTKALTKELKLTFAKAEHLKRNATAAEDPKAVFQAMRPIFNDLLTEVQRSIGFFTSIDRAAKIDRVLALGNAMKLPGLRRYLAQSLGMDVVRIEEFRNLSGPEVTAAPAFQENLLCFGVCYGLALQGLNLGSLRTNLLPKEIAKDRLIRQKKPWVVGAAALLLMGLAINFGNRSLALARLNTPDFTAAEGAAKQVDTAHSQYEKDKKAATEEYLTHDTLGSTLVSNVEGRIVWLEVLKAINACLPRDPEGARSDDPDQIYLRNEVHITSLTCERSADLQGWFAAQNRRQFYPPLEGGDPAAAAVAAAPVAAAPRRPARPQKVEYVKLNEFGEPVEEPPPPGGPAEPGAPVEEEVRPASLGPAGPGWVFTLKGYHFHNTNAMGDPMQGPEFVRKALMEALATKVVRLPDADGREVDVSMKELGFGFPVLLTTKPEVTEYPLVNPFPKLPSLPFEQASAPVAEAGQAPPPAFTGFAPPKGKTYVYHFEVQFCWKPTPPSKRQASSAKDASTGAEAVDAALNPNPPAE